jgi:nucleoside-diphosphate-sugar epimerase
MTPLPRLSEQAGRRILVTGGSGFVGFRVVEGLCRAGAQVASVHLRRPQHRFSMSCRTRLDGREVVVVLAGYAPDDQPVGAPVAVVDPVAALWPHVRFDWVFDPSLNTHHLPRVERDRDAYARDATDRLAELAAASRVVAWRHHGALAPLLDSVADQPKGPR